MKINRFSIGLTLLFIFLAFIVVSAGTMYTVVIEEVDSSSYPRVQVSFRLNGNSDEMVGRNFWIYENGSRNNGPIIVLPPKSPGSKVDLFVLLDRSGNTKDYESMIKSNLKSLAVYMQESGIDLNINLMDFGSDDSSQNTSMRSFASAADFSSAVDNISFDSARLAKAYGLNKIHQIASSSARPGAEKVALIINGSQFYDKDMGDSTTYTLDETFEQLALYDFTVFAVGYPVKQIHSLNKFIADKSITHNVAGGYLGGFATDLTVIHDLLQKQNSNHYVLQFYSNNAGGSSGELYVGGYNTESFSYSKSGSAFPGLVYATGNEAFIGHPFPVRVEVAPNGQLINAVEMIYLNKENQIIKSALLHKKSEDTENNTVYTGEIPEDEFPSDFIKYYVKIYTPYDVIGSEDGYISIPVFTYNEGVNTLSE